MTSLLYLANVRMPTEKAHGLQISEMCEAFAQTGHDVTLVVPSRHNKPNLKNQELWEYYGIEPVFKLKKLWVIDIARFLPRAIFSAAHLLQGLSFYFTVLIWLTRQPPSAVLYSRDVYIHWLLSWLFAGRIRIYEAHSTTHTRVGLWIQRRVLKSSSLVIAVTKHLATYLEDQGNRPVLIEPDGFRTARFANMPSREESRDLLNIPSGSFVAGYLGQLETMGMDKGVGTLVEAFGQGFRNWPGWSGVLLIIGGPEDSIERLRASWVSEELPHNALHAVGQVAAAKVPLYLAACDVCIMPHPWTEFFAYHTSPLKLFEYMGAGRAILATDMPVFHEVLTEGENALFVPPSDPEAMSNALLNLSDDSSLLNRLGTNNLKAAQLYTWDARAQRIIGALDAFIGTASSS